MPNARSTRGFTWVDTLLDQQVASGAKNTVSLMADIDTQDRRSWTLTRTIFCYDLSPIIQGVALGAQKVALGIGIASQEAFNASVLADPDQATDFPVRGWVYRCLHRVLDDAAEGHPPQAFYRDLKGQRKIDTGELFLTIDNAADSGTTFSIVVVGIARCLFRT